MNNLLERVVPLPELLPGIQSYRGRYYQILICISKDQVDLASICIQQVPDPGLKVPYYDRQLWKIRLQKNWNNLDLIFPSTTCTPQVQPDLVRRLLGLGKRAGLRRIRFHEMRHAAVVPDAQPWRNP